MTPDDDDVERRQQPLVATDIAGSSMDALDELALSVDHLDHVNRRLGGGLEAEIDAIRTRLDDRRAQVEDLQELAGIGDAAQAGDIIRLRPLLGAVLRQRYGQRPGVGKHVDIDDIPNIRGHEILARMVLRHLLVFLVPQQSADALALRIGSRTEGGRVILRADTGPATLSDGEEARRKAARAPLEDMAARQGWQASLRDAPDGAACAKIEAPLATTPEPAPIGTGRN